uniref:Ricin B-type lectin domain-containing protein n=1 Tax=Angiostrongylus cantonensis TaxID=6313 RepID=A0A0K0DDI7_ANGCA
MQSLVLKGDADKPKYSCATIFDSTVKNNKDVSRNVLLLNECSDMPMKRVSEWTVIAPDYWITVVACQQQVTVVERASTVISPLRTIARSVRQNREKAYLK